MVEKIGVCLMCKKAVYCIGEFLNGVVDTREVYCFDFLKG